MNETIIWTRCVMGVLALLFLGLAFHYSYLRTSHQMSRELASEKIYPLYDASFKT